jgi:hypothetical protein
MLFEAERTTQYWMEAWGVEASLAGVQPREIALALTAETLAPPAAGGAHDPDAALEAAESPKALTANALYSYETPEAAPESTCCEAFAAGVEIEAQAEDPTGLRSILKPVSTREAQVQLKTIPAVPSAADNAAGASGTWVKSVDARTIAFSARRLSFTWRASVSVTVSALPRLRDIEKMWFPEARVAE